MSDDDDLRFGDVGGGGNGSSGSGGFEPAPLAVAAIVVVILLFGQPLSGEMGSLDMNIVGALIVGIGGVLAAFGV
jgi:hypothetical protein